MHLLLIIKLLKTDEDIETEFPLENFPTPAELWKRYKKLHNIKDTEESLVLQPYYVDGSTKEPRYYQVEAINRTIEAVAKGQKRILLVMATGTGKTVYYFSNHMAFMEGKSCEKNSISCRQKYIS